MGLAGRESKRRNLGSSREGRVLEQRKGRHPEPVRQPPDRQTWEKQESRTYKKGKSQKALRRNVDELMVKLSYKS